MKWFLLVPLKKVLYVDTNQPQNLKQTSKIQLVRQCKSLNYKFATLQQSLTFSYVSL